MSINLSIIDQQLLGIEEQIRDRAKDELGITGGRLKSLAFVYLCVKTMLDLEPDEAFECLTEGGGDFGVDAVHVSVPTDRDLIITLFQGKYQEKLDGNSEFGENAIEKLISACRYLFNPGAEVRNINPRLKAKIEDIRSFIRDGIIPRIRIIACNNGRKWNKSSQEAIDRFDNGDQLTWEYVNHDVLVNILQRIRDVDETISLSGKAIVEDMNYSRVCIGRVAVSEIARLMKNHGDRLLERNIRSYLGLHGNRVNEDIRNTLRSAEPSNFYFFNNGLTVICNDFSYNALQERDFKVNLENFQIVNGGQTCMTILKTFEEFQQEERGLPEEAYVLIRIYKLPKDEQDIVSQITNATNNQNPVDLKDLHANDEKQRRLTMSIESLGYSYRRKRMETAAKSNEITTGTAAEAVLSIWRGSPQQAKFYSREHFGKLYHTIFTETLNGAQVILAVLLYRFAETRRRRPHENDPPLVRYASCFLAMLMGKRLLRDMKLERIEELGHRNFHEAKTLLENEENNYFESAKKEIEQALGRLYGEDWESKTSMQQLAATFRRGDLISLLQS